VGKLKGHRKQSFIQGAIILTLGIGVTKLFGAVYQIILANMIGDEGVGLFNLAYPTYVILVTLSMGGLSVAVSKMVAARLAQGDGQAAWRAFTLAELFLFISGVVFAALLYLLADMFAIHLARDPRAALAIRALSPAILVVTLMSGLRGLFQGLQDMTPSSISYVAEQLVRVVTIIALAAVLLPYGLEYAAAGACFGALPGALAGLVFLLYVAWRRGVAGELGRLAPAGGIQDSPAAIVSELFRIAIPISMAALIQPILQQLDVFMVPVRLGVAGLSEVSTPLYGQLSMAGRILYAPAVFTTALAVSLLPAIAEAAAVDNIEVVKSRTVTAMRLALLLALPASAGLYVLARPIGVTLFNLSEVGVPLMVLAPGFTFLALQQMSSATLQGLGRPDLPARHLVLGAVPKVALTWWLTALPAWNIAGAAAGTLSALAAASLLNLVAVCRLSGLRPDIWSLLVRPLLAVGVMVVGVKAVYAWVFALRAPIPDESLRLTTAMATTVAIGAGVIIYGMALLVVGGIRAEDLESVPRIGKRLAAVLRRLRLVA